MKRSIIILMAAASLAALSCTKEVNDQTAPEREQVTMSFDATIGTPTKVELGDANGEGGYKVLWSVGDAITVISNVESTTSGYTNGSEFTTDITLANATASFTGEAEVGDSYYALYPYDSNHRWYYDNDRFSAVFNVTQTADGLGNGLLVAEEVEGNLQFKHVTGYVKFEIPSSYSKITKVTFTGKNKETIGGKYVYVLPNEDVMHEVTSSNAATSLTLIPSAETFAPGTYYLATLPASLSSGFVMTFTDADGAVATKEGTNPAEIKAGDILNLGTITGLDFVNTTPSIADGAYAIVAKTADKFYYMTNEDAGASTKRLLAEEYVQSSLPSSMPSINPAFVWNFSFEAGKYQISSVNGKYVSHTSGNSMVLSEAGVAVTVDENEGVYVLHYTASDEERNIALNTSGYFAFYKESSFANNPDYLVKNLYLVPATADANAKITSVVTNDPSGITSTGGVLNGVYDGYNLDDATITVGFELNGTSYTATEGDNYTFAYTIDGLTVGQSYTYKAWASLDGGATKVYGEEKTITPEAAVATASVTMDLTAQGYANQQKVESLAVDPITVSFAQGTHTNAAPTYYTSTSNGPALRYYKGNTITFAGAVIRKIEITAPGSSYCNLSCTSGSLNVSDKVTTWEGRSESVLLTGSGSGRITNIVITYEAN